MKCQINNWNDFVNIHMAHLIQDEICAHYRHQIIFVIWIGFGVKLDLGYFSILDTHLVKMGHRKTFLDGFCPIFFCISSKYDVITAKENLI